MTSLREAHDEPPLSESRPFTSLTYPPFLDDDKLEALVAEATDYQLTHGSLIKYVHLSQPHTVPAAPIGASLFPTPFPRRCCDEAQDLRELMNKLYAAAAADDLWIEKVLKGMIEHDAFIKCLWEIHCEVKRRPPLDPGPLHLGIWRSDYMLHGSDMASARIKQVEFNTFSCSGGTHSSLVNGMHRHLIRKGVYASLIKERELITADNPPRNPALEGIIRELAAAHSLSTLTLSSPAQCRGTCILMTVQPFNKNIADERPIEYGLWDSNISCFRVVFGEDILRRTRLLEDRTLLYYNGPLPNSTPASPITAANPLEDSPICYSGPSTNCHEVTLVYHRAGYAAPEYAPEVQPHGPAARLRLELSRATQCPSLTSQLTTTKLVQAALTDPAALDHLLPAETPEQKARLQAVFAPMLPLADPTLGSEALAIARDPVRAKDYILKPSREGGGNNIHRGAIAEFVARRDAERADVNERARWAGWVLMRCIEPPREVHNTLIAPAGGWEGRVVSELGVLGGCLWRVGEGGAEILRNEGIGWTFKTKAEEQEEMSVIKGFGCFDSPLLVDF